MNDTVKDILSDKLLSAKLREGLDNSEVAQILGLNSKHYTGKICSQSENQRSNVPEEAWIAVQKWTNSGLNLRKYGEKMGKLAEAKQTIEDTKTELGHTEVNEDFDAGSIAAADVRPGDELTLIVGKTEIGRAVVDKIEIEKSSSGIQDMPADRLKILFDAIAELKDLGYRVDINIYEKESK